MTSKMPELQRFFLLLALALPLAACPRDAVDEKRATTRLDLAKDFLRRNQLDTAELEARKAIALDAENADAEYVLGMVAFLRGVGNARLLEVDDCLTGVDAEGLQNELEAFMTAAEGHFARSVELDPAHAEAWSTRGSVASQLGDYAAAISHFERALTNPSRLLDVGVTRANLGWATFHRDDLARAAKELRQALQFHPGMCVAKYRLARVYIARKEWNKALEQLQAVVDDRSCPMQEAHLYLLKSYREVGDAEGAARAQASCTAISPKSCVAAECRAETR
jgi:tetratricopeptide (TPR) repeat protein